MRSVDIVGPLPMSRHGNEYIIVVGEYFTKWQEAFPVPNHTALTVADKLVPEVFCRFGCPAQIHSDQGREFESDLFKTVCEKLGINKTRTTPYRPQSDGLVERFNRTLKQMLSLFAHENPQDWDDHIPYLLMAYRSTEHASTKCSPNLLMLGREITMPIDLIAGPPPEETEHYCPIQYVEWLQSAMATAFDFANDQLKVAAKIQKRNYDIGLKERGYEVGNWVWRWYPPDAGQKLKLGWTGPYLVVKKISPLTYSIQKAMHVRPLSVHVDHIKPYEGQHPPMNWLAPQPDISILTEDDIDESSYEADISQHNATPSPVKTRVGRIVKPREIYSPS